MSAAELKRMLEAAREFDFQHSGVTFRMRRWSHPQYMQLLGTLPREQLGNMAATVAALVPPALVGWSGIRECDLHPSGMEAPLAFDPALVENVLDRYRAAMIPMLVELQARYEAAENFGQAEEKN
jgi:hypothetical protein